MSYVLTAIIGITTYRSVQREQAIACHTSGWKAKAVITLEVVLALSTCDIVTYDVHQFSMQSWEWPRDKASTNARMR